MSCWINWSGITCSIFDTDTTYEWWEETQVDVTIYTDIPAYILKVQPRDMDDSLADETDNDKMTLDIWVKTWAKQGMRVEITDKDLWMIWTYRIETPPVPNRARWRLRSVYLHLKKYNEI